MRPGEPSWPGPRCAPAGDLQGLSRRRALECMAAAGALGWGVAGPAQAEATYPSKPLRLVVPNPPGGLVDSVARLLADPLQSSLRQPVVVDNRPGAAGLIGTQAVVDAPADGYTLLATSTSNHVLAPLIQQSARVDPVRELQPVALALRTVGLFVVPASLEVRDLAGLVALAHSRPGRLNYASSGVGSANHVQTERFKALAGIDIVHVPFRGGAPLLSAVMSDEVQLALMDYGTAEPALRAGRVRALAQTGARRHVALPEVPLFSQAGYAAYDPAFWIGLAAPRATAAAVLATLNAAVNRALAQTAIKARAQALGWHLIGGPPSVLTETVAQELAAYRDTVSRLHLDRQ